MPKYAGSIVDVDVHHRWKDESEVRAYLPQYWREYLEGAGRAVMSIEPPIIANSALLSAGGKRADARGADGSPPGSDYDMLRAQVLDRYNYYRAVLTFDIGIEAGHKNPYLAAALCEAINNWNIETWLSRDERLYSVILLPGSNIEAAVAEIHRIGDHPRLLSVLFSTNPLGQPFGHPVYHPIYEAAAEHGLSIALHVSHGDLGNVKMIGGSAGTFIESQLHFGAQGMHYISSFIAHGVFEKFPGLKLMVKEFGISWLPHFLWKLDESYDVLRLESPWVRRLPSEYIRESVRFSTQPIEAFPLHAGEWGELMGAIDRIEDVLCFSSDYPHYSFDDPFQIARNLPKAWVAKVMCQNACAAYGWETPPETDQQMSRRVAIG